MGTRPTFTEGLSPAVPGKLFDLEQVNSQALHPDTEEDNDDGSTIQNVREPLYLVCTTFAFGFAHNFFSYFLRDRSKDSQILAALPTLGFILIQWQPGALVSEKLREIDVAECFRVI